MTISDYPQTLANIYLLTSSAEKGNVQARCDKRLWTSPSQDGGVFS